MDEFEEMIADGLSQLGRSADGTLQVYLSLFLPVSKYIYYIDTDEITGFRLLLKNHTFTAHSEHIFIFHV